MNNTEIRFVEDKDIAGILAIYGPFITDTAITFEEEIPSEDDFRERVKNIQKKSPYLVCCINGQVAGYAYATLHRERASYRWTREITVYIHPDHHRKNIGHALYTSLIDMLRSMGICTLIAIITIPNMPSIYFHEKMGFTQCAECRNIGFKHRQWRSVGWWQMLLTDETQTPPEHILSVAELVENGAYASAIAKGMTFLKND